MAEDTPSREGMAQCEITRQWVPEDEIIVIQGHRVCAAGKQELLDRLKSGEALPGEMERPTVLRRLACAFVDGIVLFVIMLGLQVVIVGETIFSAMGSPAAAEQFQQEVAMSSLLLFFIGFAYYTVLHGTRGQTLGKMAGRIKVVRPDGKAIGMGKAFVRTLAFDGPQIITPFIALSGNMQAQTLFSRIGTVYILVNVVVLLLDSAQNRAIHDRVAGTRVVAID